MRASTVAIALVPWLAACAPAADVTRVMDDRVVSGRFIEPDAYSWFLRGAIADEAGQLPSAASAFAEAAARDGDDPEVWTRLGDVQCRIALESPSAGAATTDASEPGGPFARALGLDPAYAPALEARARCRAARGDERAAREDRARAAAADPLAMRAETAPSEASRERLVAATLLHGTSPAAWDALASWAAAHGDPSLAARALGQVARLVPARKAELAGRAAAFAGDGELAAARALAASLLDEPGDRSSGGEGPAPAAMPLVARLALDEAVARGDGAAVMRRAVRAHVGLDVAAGRALLGGDAALARDLAEPLAKADPRAVGARMVLAAAAHQLADASRVASALDVRGAALARAGFVAPEALLSFARVVERASSPEAARRVLDAWPPAQLLPGDALVTSLAVDLAALGALRDDVLPLDARIELAARRSEPMPADDATGGDLDARHRLFAWALAKPLDASTLELGRRLAPAAAHDPLVAVALARLSFAAGRALSPGALDPILAADPADPILAAAALDLAKRTGDPRAIAPARARLTALARTAGERAHALE